MSVTNVEMHEFWDANGSFPGRCLSDDFEDAGYKTEHEDACTIWVIGITLDKAMEIAKPWRANYLGSYTAKVSAPPCEPATM